MIIAGRALKTLPFFWMTKGVFSPMQSTKDLHRQARNTYLYYSISFLLFCTCYSCLTYNTAYYLEIGLSNTAIGIIQSANSLGAFLLPPLMGVLADKMRSMRKALLLCISFNTLCFALLPSLRTFMPLLLFTSVFAGFRNASDSLNMTWIVSELEQKKKQGIFLNYGSIRIWGSLGYSLSCMVLNLLMSRLGLTNEGSFYIGAACMGAMVLFLLFGSGRGSTSAVPNVTPQKQKTLTLKQLKPGRLLHNYYYLTYLVVYILIWLASCFGLNYTTNLLEEIGVSTAFLGTVSGVRALFEIPAIFFSAKLAKKFGYEKCIIASGIAFTLESFIFLYAQNSMMVLAAQVLHGLFDGLFMGLYVSYLFTLVPHSLAATTQTINMALANVVSMVFYLLGGAIIDRLGVRPVFYVAAVIPAAGVLWFIITLAIGKARKIPRYDMAQDPVEQALQQ